MSFVGGTSLSGAIADSQAQLGQWLGAPPDGLDTVSGFASAYRASGGGPALQFVGLNPFQVVDAPAFRQLYWGAVVVFLGIMTVTAMQQCLMGRQSLLARHPIASVAQVYFRLLAGVLILSNIPLAYGILMTLNSALSAGIEAMARPASPRLFHDGAGALILARARADAIREASARRATALFPSGAARQEMLAVGDWYEAVATSLNGALESQGRPERLARLPAGWDAADIPDDRLTASVGRVVIQNFAPLLARLAELPADRGALTVAFPAGSSSALPPLSVALADADSAAAAALSLPNTPASDDAFEAARGDYRKAVLAAALRYLDGDFRAVLAASPSLERIAQGWFAPEVEAAAVGAHGTLTGLQAAVDWAGRGVGVMLTRAVSFLLVAGSRLLIEIDLFVLVPAMPLWLLPATEDAFHGVLRSLLSLSLAAPAYQFLMLFVDALMGLILRYATLGPGAAGSGHGAVYAAVAVIGAGGEFIALATACYLVAYLFLAVYVALRTPRIVARFLKGAGAGGAFLTTFATGLVAGAATALATAAAGGGGLATRILASPADSGGRAGAPRSAGSVAPSSRSSAARPVLGPLTPTRAAPARALRLGAVAFTSALSADTPLEGCRLVAQALERERRRQLKPARKAAGSSSPAP